MAIPRDSASPSSVSEQQDINKQLVPVISRAETAAAMQIQNNAAADDEDSDEEFVDAPEALSRGASQEPFQNNAIDISDDEEEENDEADETKSNATDVDLFAATFGKAAEGDDEGLDVGHSSGDPSAEHAKGCTSTTTRRMSTPPLPDPDLVITSITKKATPPDTSKPKDTKEEGRIRPGPDIDRDLSDTLRRHFKFHDRVIGLIPRLNAPDFNWSKRYWIAVLMHDKAAKHGVTERDFVWMKGNRLSTGRTIWHRYVETMVADRETTVLMLGTERLDMETTMEECDFFGDRFVLLRAVVEGTERARVKPLLEDLKWKEPEVMVIDD